MEINEINEEKIYTALGLEKPEVKPADDPTPEEGPEAQEPGAETPEPKDGSATEPMSADQRHQNAARRRAAEEKQRIDAAVADALAKEREKTDAEWKTFFQDAGLKNSISGAPITNREEFAGWKEDFANARLEKNLKSGKLTKDDLAAIVASDPTVQAAQKIIDGQAAADEKQRQDAAMERVKAELDEIRKVDPSISTVADLLKMPTAKEFYSYVAKGLSYTEAYYLANRQRLSEQTVEAARTQAGNNMRGKDHLASGLTGRSTGAVSVPSEEMAIFKRLNPKATPAEIQAYYNKYHSSK